MASVLLGLMRTGLFNGLDDAFLERLADGAVRQTLAPGEVVVQEGDRADAFFVVLSGRLEVVTWSDEGDVVHLGDFEAGGYFGEQACLPTSDGRRSATVRADAKPAEVARLDASTLHEVMASDPGVEERLRAIGQTYVDNQIARRSALVRGLLAGEAEEPEVLTLDNGTVLFRQGDAADRFFVVLGGRVELLDESGERPVRLAKLGPGLCVGERDADVRTATALADGATRLLAFPNASLAGLRAGSPEIDAHLTTLEHAWELPQHGFVTQHLGTDQGHPCLSQIYNLRDGRSLIATHRIDGASVRLTTPGATAARDVRRVEDGLAVRLDADDRVIAITARGRGPALEWLFGRAIEGTPLRPEEESAFALTGSFQVVDDGFLCTCLRVRRSTVQAAVDAGATSLKALQQQTGAGLSCGSCLPSLGELLGEVSFLPVRVTSITAPTERVRRVGLARPDGRPLPPASPGQHTVLRVRLGDDSIVRPYTLSGARGGPWEVTVQREPHGVFGAWLFDAAEVGVELEASRPRGDFRWDGGPAPVLFFAAGVGITPALCFARTLLEEGWPHWLVVDWSTPKASDRALLGGLEETGPANLEIAVRCTATDGRLTPDGVASRVRRFPSARCFVCGPRGYQDDVVAWLAEAGVPPGRVQTEDFDPRA